jgi:ferrochelatase
MRKAIILLNLGSPTTDSATDVRSYLKQFLNDPYVIDLPFLMRWLLVNGIILNTRPKKSAHAYQKIWNKNAAPGESGSPLVTHTLLLAKKLQELLKNHSNDLVIPAMRYGSPSIESALNIAKENKVDSILFFPLYPQYSYAASESSIQEFLKNKKQILPDAGSTIIEDFFDLPTLKTEFTAAVAKTIQTQWDQFRPDLLLYSYHGVPERQLQKVKDCPATNNCCVPYCCDSLNEKNKKCYKAQCYETSRLIDQALNLKPSQSQVSFQSRLGRTKWIEPYTDFVIPELPKNRIKRLLVVSPSFTADCLETLEEIKMQYSDLFMQSGGEAFEYVPCLNSSDDFVVVLKNAIEKAKNYIPNGKSL